ncbi:MAG: ion channel [Candidatus Korobacteraceae bacterium]
MGSKEESNPVAIAIFYGIATVTIAAYGYGIGGMDSLRAGAIYAIVGLVLAFACVGFAPRFIVVVALATGMLGSMMRASIAPEITSLIPKQNTIDYLQKMVTVCGAIGFGGGLYGGFRFTGEGIFNWVSKALIKRLPAPHVKSVPLQYHALRQLLHHFYASERMYFSVLAAFGSALIAGIELHPIPRSVVIILLAVLIATNLAWFLGEWLRPRLRVLVGVFRILQQMWEALLAFLLGYAAIIFIFACFYAAAWQHNRASAFQGMNMASPVPPSFGQFVYFSVVTMATLGYGDVIPSDALTRTLACVEVVIGVGWVTVVLSAASALARPRVNQMLKEVWQEEGETDAE